MQLLKLTTVTNHVVFINPLLITAIIEASREFDPKQKVTEVYVAGDKEAWQVKEDLNSVYTKFMSL